MPMDDFAQNLSVLSTADIEYSTDEILGLLSKREVRVTLAYLYDHPEATLDELATVVTGIGAADEGRIGTESDYKRAYVRLYHSTLPRLDDHGLLEFDSSERTVSDVDVPPVIYTVLGVDE